jgi:hypothetical protein
MIAFIDLEFSANPVELVHKSIKEVKGKSHSIHELQFYRGVQETMQSQNKLSLQEHHANPISTGKNFSRTTIHGTRSSCHSLL